MENASKALIIAGAILLSILIIAIGMYIYTSSQSTITDSMAQMSTQEIEAFNSQFTAYGGKQTGAQLKSLMGKLISNANTYKEEPEKLPSVTVSKYSANDSATGGHEAAQPEDSDEDNLQTYIDSLSEMRNKMENKHTFNVEFEYNTNGILIAINIDYGDSSSAGGTGGGTTNPGT